MCSSDLLQNIKDIKGRYQRKGTDLKLLTDRMGLSDITAARPAPGIFSRQSVNQ